MKVRTTNYAYKIVVRNYRIRQNITRRAIGTVLFIHDVRHREFVGFYYYYLCMVKLMNNNHYRTYFIIPNCPRTNIYVSNNIDINVYRLCVPNIYQ